MKNHRLSLILITVVLIPVFLSCSSKVSETIDLASDTAWELCIDDGPWRNIKVPGGGYNSDLQDQPLIDQENVRDHVTYKRSITIPGFGKGDVIKINFGGVNHGCDEYLNDMYVGGHAGPMMPFDVDITDFVEPGGEYELKVVSYPQWHYHYEVPHAFVYDEYRNHPDTKPDWSSEVGWATKFGYGITKSVGLVVLPGVYISDVFVQPSVTENSLRYDVWIHNHTGKSKEVEIISGLNSWNGDQWNYPVLDPVNVIISPRQIKKIEIGPVQWKPGPESYWWPNKPFREEYKARLHNLTIAVLEKNKEWDSRIQRFGFVEWTEGPNYYMVNGVRINQVSDGTPEPAMSEYDCYSVSPAFLPPTDSTLGCQETWKRYMRLGICANRIHQSTPTEYMMNAADENGFMLIPETGIRGCQTQNWHSTYLPQAVMELARICRNHPSVCRYSLQNEADPLWIPVLIDSVKKVDHLRPLVFEDNQINKPERIDGKSGHAYAMLHYVDYPKPAQIITGMGEYAWHWADREKWGPVLPSTEGGLEEFIYYGGDMRRWDIVYFAGWDFINYWPNFLEGMNYEKHAWKQSCYPKDRMDGEDGWNSPVVKWMQKYFHPYLVMDLGIHKMNGPDSDLSEWPEYTSSYSPGDSIERNLEVYNDGLRGNLFTILWETHWDSLEGESVDSGRIENLRIEPGFHQTIKLKFKAPGTDEGDRRLNIILSSELDGRQVFKENDIYFLIKNNYK
jgi:hypothetical protein